MALADIATLEVEQDLVYGRGGARDLLCDVYRPAPSLTKKTAVVHFHGGGFRGGSKAGARVARPLAALGYTCVSASYRVLPEATWPSQVDDVKAAINWTRANAERLGFDASRLAVLGYSAGAQLALIAAGSQMDVGACVAFYSPTGANGAHPVLGPNPSEEQRRSFNALDHIKPGYPPTILFHGASDTMVPLDNGLEIFAKLRDIGTAVELHVVEGVTHIFDSHADLAQASATWIDLFLDRHVVNPRAYPSTEPRR